METNLSAWIRAKKIKQNEFARILGISEPFLSQLKNGSHTPSLEVAHRIAIETKGKVPMNCWLDAKAIDSGAA